MDRYINTDRRKIGPDNLIQLFREYTYLTLLLTYHMILTLLMGLYVQKRWYKYECTTCIIRLQCILLHQHCVFLFYDTKSQEF